QGRRRRQGDMHGKDSISGVEIEVHRLRLRSAGRQGQHLEEGMDIFLCYKDNECVAYQPVRGKIQYPGASFVDPCDPAPAIQDVEAKRSSLIDFLINFFAVPERIYFAQNPRLQPFAPQPARTSRGGTAVS